MQSHHRIYTDESLQARDVMLNSAHATVDVNTSCLLSCSLFYSIHGLFATSEMIYHRGGEPERAMHC